MHQRGRRLGEDLVLGADESLSMQPFGRRASSPPCPHQARNLGDHLDAASRGESEGIWVKLRAFQGYLHQDAPAWVALLVEGAERVTAHSGHHVMIDNAPMVIDAIDTIVDAVRDNRSAATA